MKRLTSRMKPMALVATRWTEILAYWRKTAARRRMPAGATAGLTLVAVACLSIGTFSYQAFGPRDVIAHQAVTAAV